MHLQQPTFILQNYLNVKISYISYAQNKNILISYYCNYGILKVIVQSDKEIYTVQSNKVLEHTPEKASCRCLKVFSISAVSITSSAGFGS